MIDANYYYYADLSFHSSTNSRHSDPLECLENHMIVGHTLFLSIPLRCVTELTGLDYKRLNENFFSFMH